MMLNFRPCVYMRDRTHSYLWIRDGRSYAYFLTMDTGTITVAKVDMVEVGKETIYRVFESGQVSWDLEPKDYNPMQAIQKYYDSLLPRSPAAEREMRMLLDMPPLEGLTDDGEDVTPGPRKQAASKPAKASSKPSTGKPSGGGGYSLATLCEELKMDPSEARKILRGKKIEKPGGKWEWPNAEAALSVRKALGG